MTSLRELDRRDYKWIEGYEMLKTFWNVLWNGKKHNKNG